MDDVFRLARGFASKRSGKAGQSPARPAVDTEARDQETVRWSRPDSERTAASLCADRVAGRTARSNPDFAGLWAALGVRRPSCSNDRHNQIRSVGDQPIHAPVQQSPRVVGGVDRPDLDAQSGAMGVGDEARRDHPGPARPLRHLIAVVRDAGDRPAAPRSIERPRGLLRERRSSPSTAPARARRGGPSVRTTRGRPDRRRRRREPRPPPPRAISALLTFSSTMIGTSRIAAQHVAQASARRCPGRETGSRRRARRHSRRRLAPDPPPSGRRPRRAGWWSGRARGRDARRPRRRGRDERPTPGRRRRAPGRGRTRPACSPARARCRPDARRRAAAVEKKGCGMRNVAVTR